MKILWFFLIALSFNFLLFFNALVLRAATLAVSKTLYIPYLEHSIPSATPTRTQTPTATRTPTHTATPTPTDTPDPATGDPDWLILVNQYRILAGVPAVSEDPTLSNNCWQHARYIAENNHLSHQQNPDLPYASEAGQICAGNGNAWIGGEFSRPYWTTQHSINSWMRSSAHRLWLLYPTTPTFGYGFYAAANNRAAAALDVLTYFDGALDGDYPDWPVRYPSAGQISVPAEVYPVTLLWPYFGPAPVVSTHTFKTAGGSNVSHVFSTSLQGGHKGVELVPSSALADNTIYTITVKGQYDGQPFTYTWSFSTGDTPLP